MHLFLIANIVTTSKALVTSSDAVACYQQTLLLLVRHLLLVAVHLFLMANIVTTSTALVTSSDALVSKSKQCCY